MRHFIEGFFYPFKNIGLFFKYPKTILYSIIPVSLNLIIYVLSFVYFFNKIMYGSGKLTGAMGPDPGFFAEFFHAVILVVSFLILLVLCYFIIVIVGGIVSAPFNENISLIIEEALTGRKTDYHPGFWKDTWYNILAELKKLAFYFSFLLIFFLIGFIPLIGEIISVVLGTIFSFFFNALDFFDYPMTRKYFTLRDKIKVTYAKPMYTLGFGCASFLIMFLPVVNVLMKPLCVVSGTAFYFEKKYDLINLKTN
ncbi:MAG: EI24 domain-containing protein [Ignavibacteriota bacterium]